MSDVYVGIGTKVKAEATGPDHVKAYKEGFKSF